MGANAPVTVIPLRALIRAADPSGRFNASLNGGTRRAIDVREGATIDAEALKALVRESVVLNVIGKAPKHG